MNILLFGLPGAGKGTQSAHLVEKMGMHHISTGDLFRYAVKNKTTLGVEAKSYMDKGELVPDSIVIGMVEEEFINKLEGKGFILDGFPRTVIQAQALKNLLSLHKLNIDKAIFLNVSHDVVIERMGGRRICRGCGAVYHIITVPPKKEGVCDSCGGEVYQRDDDQEEAIKKRLEVYEDSTKPLKEYYKLLGSLEELDGTGSGDEVFARIHAVIEK